MKKTKTVLLLSLTSLLLCASMFVGSTYAWFTVSVVSRNNVIRSGKLQVSLEMGVLKSDATRATDGASVGCYEVDDYNWISIDNNTKILNEEELFEPGALQTCPLRVKNEGTVSLQYALGTNVAFEKQGINVYGDPFLLSDHLKVALVRDRVDLGEKEDALKYIEAGYSSDAVQGNMKNLSVTGALSGDTRFAYYTVLVTMPDPADNKANYKSGTQGPTVCFGLNLYATQYGGESDGFGSDYDSGAVIEKAPTANVTMMASPPHVKATAGMGGPEITLTPGGGMQTDAAFRFETTETRDAAAQSKYRFWHADFVVTTDKDVAADSLALTGYYEFYCKNYNQDRWVAMVNTDQTLTAGEERRLLAYLLDGGSMSYEKLCETAPVFDCGVADLSEFLPDTNGDGLPDTTCVGTTVTVELRLYEVTENVEGVSAETGNFITLGSYRYTF